MVAAAKNYGRKIPDRNSHCSVNCIIANILRATVIIISVILISCSAGTGKRSETMQTLSLKEFKDSLNTAVFTTKFVVIDKKDITLVRHEPGDGAWTFFSSDKYEDYESIAKIVGLGEIIKIDSTILEIADLPKGYYASRKSRQYMWKVEKLKEK